MGSQQGILILATVSLSNDLCRFHLVCLLRLCKPSLCLPCGWIRLDAAQVTRIKE